MIKEKQKTGQESSKMLLYCNLKPFSERGWTDCVKKMSVGRKED